MITGYIVVLVEVDNIVTGPYKTTGNEVHVSVFEAKRITELTSLLFEG